MARFGIIITKKGPYTYVATSRRLYGNPVLAWLLAIVIGVIGAFIWSAF